MRFSQEKEGTTGKGKGGGVDEKMVPLRFLCVGFFLNTFSIYSIFPHLQADSFTPPPSLYV